MLTYDIRLCNTVDLCESAIWGTKDASKYIGSFNSNRNFVSGDFIHYVGVTYKVQRVMYKCNSDGSRELVLLCTLVVEQSPGF